jgi:hypothetical protein
MSNENEKIETEKSDVQLVKYAIETGTWKGEIMAENHFQAIKKFFEMVKKKEISLDQLGILGLVRIENHGQVPFRIPPALYAAKLIDYDDYVATMLQVGEFNEKQLRFMAKQDAWMVDNS